MNWARSQSGAAVVEAALILPLVILITMGSIDFGRAFLASAAVQEVAQEGALYAAHNPTDPTGAVARAEASVSDPAFLGAVSITCDAMFQVRVTVDYTFNAITPFAPASIDLGHSEVARVLTSDPCQPSPPGP